MEGATSALNFQCFDYNESSLNAYIVECNGLIFIYLIALSGLLSTVIGLVLLCKVCSILRRKRKAKSKFVRQTSVRGSVRHNTHGGSYNVRTQEQQLQLPLHQNRFEYVDMLAETPTSRHAWSEDNIAASFDQSTQPDVGEEVVLDDRVYDEPNTSDGTRSQRVRASTISTQEPFKFTRSSSLPGQKHTSTGLQRGMSARESTRSMPGVILHQANLNASDQSPQVTEFQEGTPAKKRARSMYDPLPNLPTEHSNELNPVLESEAVVTTRIVLASDREDSLVVNSEADQTLSRTTSEKQFAFEDGTLLQKDIPSFQDPEISGEFEGDDDVIEISIYSSQILSKFKADESEEESTDDCLGDNNYVMYEEVGSVPQTEPKQQDKYSSLNRSHQKQSISLDQIDRERSSPEGASAAVYSKVRNEDSISVHNDRSLEEQSEALYDSPIVVVTKPKESEISLKDITDPNNLFDDPGYTEGMMGGKSKDNNDPRNLFDDPGYTEGMIAGKHESTGTAIVSKHEFLDRSAMATFPRNARKAPVEKTNHESQASEQSSLRVLTVQAKALEQSMNSLTVLDFQEDELSELDPDIASCLFTTDETDQQISYV